MVLAFTLPKAYELKKDEVDSLAAKAHHHGRVRHRHDLHAGGLYGAQLYMQAGLMMHFIGHAPMADLRAVPLLPELSKQPTSHPCML